MFRALIRNYGNTFFSPSFNPSRLTRLEGTNRGGPRMILYWDDFVFVHVRGGDSDET